MKIEWWKGKDLSGRWMVQLRIGRWMFWFKPHGRLWVRLRQNRAYIYHYPPMFQIHRNRW